MTDQASGGVHTDLDNVRAVETFLYALQDQDFDVADTLLADNAEWQNVGYPTIRGRQRIVGLMRRGQGRFGFEVKIHRIAAEGNSVLTERTDALVFGRCDCSSGCAEPSSCMPGESRCGATTSTPWTSSRPPCAGWPRRCSRRCVPRCS